VADWKTDLSDSAFEFQRVVWPVVSRACGGGELVPVESVSEAGFAKQLDMHSGVDAWQIHTRTGLRAIASRIQWGSSWRTFTIRKARFNGTETEYDKRLRAIRENKGWLWPYLTIQAYIALPRREGQLLSCAVARTEDVIDMIAEGHCTRNQTWNAEFWVVHWDDLIEQKRQIWQYKATQTVEA
jgi:hypothetical protein